MQNAAMDNLYLQLIADEQAKISALRQRIQECEERIRVLRSLVPRDELDDALTKMVSARGPFAGGGELVPVKTPETEPAADGPEAGAAASTGVSEGDTESKPAGGEADHGVLADGDGYKTPTRKLPTSALRMLAFVSEPRTRAQMKEFAAGSDNPLSPSALSTFVWTYRTQYGFVVVDGDGSVQITDRGREYLREHYKQETPEPVAADSGVVSTQVADLALTGGNNREGGC